MGSFLKKQKISLHIERLFTSDELDAFDLIHFREAGDEAALEAPHNWSNEAAAALGGDAACQEIPAETRAIEENTVPSWLWRHVPEGSERVEETSAAQIFNRVAGSAAYRGWKQDLFENEAEARIFFDEIRYLLAQRFIAFEPRALAALGLDWAYGMETKEPSVTRNPQDAPTPIANARIDAVLAGDKTAHGEWKKFLVTGVKNHALALRFTDIAADWNSSASQASPQAAFDLMLFRREDGGVDIDRLRHAVRLAATLIDLQTGGADFTLGFANLAPLLIALGLPYDGNGARATAAALAAIVTAEAYATSAKLAGLLGAGANYAAHHNDILRALRNHRRGAYGDRNDYEKISVLPAPLAIDPAADLALVAAARLIWDEALELTHHHGLRAAQVSGLFTSPALGFFMESAVQGIEPLASLTVAQPTESGTFARELHPAITEALKKLGYDAEARKAIAAHIAGAQTLKGAPGIDHAALRRKGFDDAAITRLEDYLPYADDVRVAATPWILGEAFCRDALKIPAAKLRDPRFDLLRHLGFGIDAIKSANLYCYGRGSVVGAKGLRPAQAAIFARAREISAEARIRMAAAVQSFVSGYVDLRLALPAAANAEQTEKLVLSAWQQGLKSVAIDFVEDAPKLQKSAARSARHQHQGKAPAAPPHGVSLRRKSKAHGKMVSMKRAGSKASATASKKN